MPETLWDSLPAEPIAPPGSPGLMGALRSHVCLPQELDFGQSRRGSCRYVIVDTTNQSRTPVDHWGHARNWIQRQISYGYSPQRYRLELESTWGTPPPPFWYFRFTSGPSRGAYVYDGPRRLAISNVYDAICLVNNRDGQDSIEMVQE